MFDGMMPPWAPYGRWVGVGSRPPTMNDDQVPCSGWSRQRVRLETEQPTWLIQVPWITWSSFIAGGKNSITVGSGGMAKRSAAMQSRDRL